MTEVIGALAELGVWPDLHIQSCAAHLGTKAVKRTRKLKEQRGEARLGQFPAGGCGG